MLNLFFTVISIIFKVLNENQFITSIKVEGTRAHFRFYWGNEEAYSLIINLKDGDLLIDINDVKIIITGEVAEYQNYLPQDVVNMVWGITRLVGLIDKPNPMDILQGDTKTEVVFEKKKRISDIKPKDLDGKLSSL